MPFLSSLNNLLSDASVIFQKGVKVIIFFFFFVVFDVFIYLYLGLVRRDKPYKIEPPDPITLSK